MRYHHKKQDIYLTQYGTTYNYNHEVYSNCTLYRINNKGLCVIQQRYSDKTKRTWWTEIDPCYVDELYLNKNFKSYFDKKARIPSDGYYPTVTLRQIMWALRMKPIKKEKWETTFDRSEI